ncbi:MAG: 2-phospho-L-lactate transferase [Anaerolineaceae bacterium]|nr:2-phospho-L-lactate transferase [Anaerolineaceae bacterium]
MNEFRPSPYSNLKVSILAGGVGGAKLVLGLDRILAPGNLSAIVNTGDDFTHFGLKICPDIDSVCYSLAGLANKSYGWGLEGETWNVADGLEALGAPTWFQLGDRDLATHLERTRLLGQGQQLSRIVRDFCARWGIVSRVLPMSDDEAPTLIETSSGMILPFQDYLVKEKAQPEISRILLHGGLEPRLLPEALDAIRDAALILIAPSNPWVSIDPILALEGVREALKEKFVVAVSPIIQGKAIKGPAAKMFTELGIQPSSLAVLRHYSELLDLFVYDSSDEPFSAKDAPSRIKTVQLQTIMTDEADKIQLAQAILDIFFKMNGQS